VKISDTFESFTNSISGKSGNTLSAYQTALNRFAEFTRDVEVNQLTVKHIEKFARHIAPYAVKTRQLYLIALHRYYRWLIQEGLVSLDAATVMGLRDRFKDLTPKQHALPHTVAESIVDRLGRAAARPETLPPRADDRARGQSELRRLRNVALFHCLRTSGMRIGELTQLKRRSIGFREARVIGKGNKERIVYFDETAWDALMAYWKERGQVFGEEFAFLQHPQRVRGDPVRAESKGLSVDHAEQLFRGWCAQAGIDERVTPHTLRHVFATHVLARTSDLALVQDLLGHVSPETTRIYAQVSQERMRDAHRQAFGKRE